MRAAPERNSKTSNAGCGSCPQCYFAVKRGSESLIVSTLSKDAENTGSGWNWGENKGLVRITHPGKWEEGQV
jgi:hypothetical protein